MERLITLPDMYILYDADTPWEEDRLRYFAKRELRQAFYDRIENQLKIHGARYQIIGGEWKARERQTIDLVENMMSAPFKFR